MMKTLFSSLVIFALMISSSFAQGGPAGPPGNPVGSATFVQSGASPESVGGGVAVLINATDPTNDPITAVYYTVTGGAYLNQVFGQNYITCENIPLTSNFYLYPFPVALGGCGWFWDHNPGNKSVDIVVILQSGTTVTKHYDYVVTKPVVTELKISGPRTQLTFENNNSQIKAGFHKNGAVTIHAKVNGVGTPGTIGFTQRVDLSDMFTQKNGQSQLLTLGERLVTHLTHAWHFLVKFLIHGKPSDLLSRSACISKQNDSNSFEFLKIQACNKKQLMRKCGSFENE